jgi:hypothetical protein
LTEHCRHPGGHGFADHARPARDLRSTHSGIIEAGTIVLTGEK